MGYSLFDSFGHITSAAAGLTWGVDSWQKSAHIEASVPSAPAAVHSIIEEDALPRGEWYFAHENGVTLFADEAPNDMWETSRVIWEYTDWVTGKVYNITHITHLAWESRTDPNAVRIDQFDASMGVYNTAAWSYDISLSGGVQVLWDLKWDDIQNGVHTLAWDSYIPAQYVDRYTATPTIWAEWEYAWDLTENLSLRQSFELTIPLLYDNWVVSWDVYGGARYDFSRWGYLEFGLWADIKKYPSSIEVFGLSPYTDRDTFEAYLRAELGIWEHVTIFIQDFMNPKMSTEVWLTISAKF